ncbi:NRDE family protein [Marichromatium bheemlicum]|uniref:NRDE family protein n=1 Tax=Marichromatium bheemlicum TaxID=365339 RepID=A0ABX1I2Y1_9GAMM|nr:NRDE family protein [Marichromatium bheemlicum]NKN31837.1 NRDE family protein [Marichromatium bheemlicum]
MCTLVLLHRPGHDWPLLLGANRDELRTRPSRPPGRHWSDRPEVFAGLDLIGEGSWLGVNDHGLVAAVLDRHASLGPQAGKRSRGELVLEALDHAEAVAAAEALADLHPAAYRPFNLVVADPRAAYWLRHDGGERLRVEPIPAGLHMLCAGALDDPADPRIAAQLPRFQAAAVPDPSGADWDAWQRLLVERDAPDGQVPEAALVQCRDDGFVTRSSALLAVPAYPGFGASPHWLHAEFEPHPGAFEVLLPEPPLTPRLN